MYDPFEQAGAGTIPETANSSDTSASATAATDNAPQTAVPAALAKFHSCRWRHQGENGVAEHCTHRDVLPLAGATGFSAEAWCPDCSFYKLRRTPRKREPLPPGEYRY
jgi:hypothetical protein